MIFYLRLHKIFYNIAQLNLKEIITKQLCLDFQKEVNFTLYLIYHKANLTRYVKSSHLDSHNFRCRSWSVSEQQMSQYSFCIFFSLCKRFIISNLLSADIRKKNLMNLLAETKQHSNFWIHVLFIWKSISSFNEI